MDISRPADYFICCYTVLTRPNKVETAVHGCNSWLSVWTLSCRCPVKLSTQYQPCIIVYQSRDAILRYYQQIWYDVVEQAQGYLTNVNLLCSDLAERKQRGVFSIPFVFVWGQPHDFPFRKAMYLFCTFLNKVLHCIALQCIVLHCTLLCCVVLCGVVWCAVLCCAVHSYF